MSSSFYWAMRLMPRDRREAMFALYAYCRVLDDIADGDQPAADKRARLEACRHDLHRLAAGGSPEWPEVAALAAPMRHFHLPAEELEAVIDGMAMDVDGPMVAPPLDTLALYCRRVAGAVGAVALHIFGRPDAQPLAEVLGEALQFTNILRDVAEDAALGRLYLPAELLADHGIAELPPRAVLKHSNLPAACATFARLAERRFNDAEAEIARLGRRGLWPAMVMAATYRHLLHRLERRGWRPGPPLRLSRLERLWIALRVTATR